MPADVDACGCGGLLLFGIHLAQMMGGSKLSLCVLSQRSLAFLSRKWGIETEWHAARVLHDEGGVISNLPTPPHPFASRRSSAIRLRTAAAGARAHGRFRVSHSETGDLLSFESR